MTTVNPDWEARYQHLKEKFPKIDLGANNLCRNLISSNILTPEEAARCQWKIRLIEPFVTRMVVNMIKGTMKYPTDDWPPEVWDDMGMDDRADGENYGLLKDDKLRKLGLVPMTPEQEQQVRDLRELQEQQALDFLIAAEENKE